MADIPSLDSLQLANTPVTQIGGMVAAGLLFLRWLLGMAGARQDARIAKLESEGVNNNNKLMALAHALSEVMSVLERHDTTDPILEVARSHALDRARKAIADVFPAEAPQHGER
jgi:hypothetical protein